MGGPARKRARPSGELHKMAKLELGIRRGKRVQRKLRRHARLGSRKPRTEAETVWPVGRPPPNSRPGPHYRPAPEVGTAPRTSPPASPRRDTGELGMSHSRSPRSPHAFRPPGRLVPGRVELSITESASNSLVTSRSSHVLSSKAPFSARSNTFFLTKWLLEAGRRAEPRVSQTSSAMGSPPAMTSERAGGISRSSRSAPGSNRVWRIVASRFSGP